MAIAASFAGNLGQDGDLKFITNGTALLSFSVAVSYFDKEKKTQWVRCSLFGKRAETLAPMMIRGASVFVRGALRLTEFAPRDGGEKKTSLECNVDDVEFVGGKGDVASRGTARPQGAPRIAPPAPTAAAYGQAPPRGFGAAATGQGQRGGYGGGAGYGGGGSAPFAEPGGDDGDIPFGTSAFDPHRWP